MVLFEYFIKFYKIVFECHRADQFRQQRHHPQRHLDNYAVGYWGNDGKFYTVEFIINQLEDTGKDFFVRGQPGEGIDGDKQPIKIVLTVAHLDHDVTNNRDENLKLQPE